MDRGAWWATVHRHHEHLGTTEQLKHTHKHTHTQEACLITEYNLEKWNIII